MKKKIIIISFIFCLIISLFIITNTKKDKSFIVNGIKYSTTLDGSYVSSFPVSGNYEVTVECENAKGEWNYTKWVAEISGVTGYPSCNISFTSTIATNFNDYIISLSGTTQGTGKVVNENGYRYEGKNPNNYVYFNNELWRIIGVFDSASHGVSNTNLVKIIRNDSIGGYTTDIISLLNNNYYNATNETNNDYCYQYATSVTGNCDYTEIGLQTKYRNMVQLTIFHFGNVNENFYRGSVAEEFYTYEINDGVITTRNIGLMYASDYGYSVLSSSCTRTTKLSSYDTNICAGDAWLKKESDEYVMDISQCDENFFIGMSGEIYDFEIAAPKDIDLGYAVRPVLYLKSNVVRYAGDGSISNPYQIRLES